MDGARDYPGGQPWLWLWDQPVSFAGEKCQALLIMPNPGNGWLIGDAGWLNYGPVDSATAKKLREWKGKNAALRTTITKVDVRLFTAEETKEFPRVASREPAFEWSSAVARYWPS